MTIKQTKHTLEYLQPAYMAYRIYTSGV